MATTTFSSKMIDPEDQVTTKTLLHEAIPLTGTIVSGTYSDDNIKNYSHGMFQSVYDYPYLSSSANHIFDITLGYSADSSYYDTDNLLNSKKVNIYNQMAQVLYGYDSNGAIKPFDSDGDLVGSTDDKMKECVFLSFSRLLAKDEIHKGSFQLTLGTKAAKDYAGEVFEKRITVKDVDAQTSFKINSPVGEYGILIAGEATSGDVLNNDAGTLAAGAKCGLIFYQAGVVVLTSSLFLDLDDHGLLHNTNGTLAMNDSANDMKYMFTSASISGSADALRNRIYDIQFNNTVELNSTIYFCRINHDEFNYSSNPTYLSSSQIRVKNVESDTPVSYITSIGLYDEDDTLLAVGKLSEPLRKDPTIEYTLRARLDY
jgi:hypothetical protein